MPYASNSELPDNVKKMSAAKQTAFRKAFNAAHKEYGKEDAAFKVAYSAASKIKESEDQPRNEKGEWTAEDATMDSLLEKRRLQKQARERALKIQAVRQDKLSKESAMRFITKELIDEAVKHLVSGKDGDHLPVSDESGKPNHRLMGAAWAALHGGYRGNKYEGPNKSAAVSKLKAMYKEEKMDTPSESFAITGGSFLEEALMKDDSFFSIQNKVEAAITANIRAGVDMDCDDDGPQDMNDYAWVMDLFPEYAVYSMNGCLYQVGYTVDADGDVHLGPPECVQMAYVPDEPEQESFGESADPCVIDESGYDSTKGAITVTVIKPGLSKNNRFYSPDLLRKSFKIFEGAKMFADHQTDAESKSRPEGSTRDWVGNLTKVWPESDGTIRGSAVIVDPTFKAKLDLLHQHKLLPQMGVSIRAVGEASDGMVEGKKAKIVESLTAARSVDFVTFAGAGGQVETLE